MLSKPLPRFAAAAYLLLLALWLLLHFTVGDHLLYMTLVNAAGLAFFLPLPFVLPVVWTWPNWPLRLLWIAGALAFFALWGPMLLPGGGEPVEDADLLRLLTYNAQGSAGEWQRAADTVASAEADIVLLQEVTPELADTLVERLGERFPYRLLDPRPGSSGLAIFSTLPFEVEAQGLPTQWNGDPQLIRVQWGQDSFRLLNLHTWASGPSSPSFFRMAVEARRQNFQYLEAQIPVWLADGPLLIAGDFNITHLNEGYPEMTAELRDAWWQAGTGLGHTYPVSNVPSGPIVIKYGLPLPQQLIRLDYVFVSPEWRIGDARLAEYLGGGDHRGVIVELALSDAP